MENEGCVLVKKKELEELKLLANSKKSDVIYVKYYYGYHGYHSMIDTRDLDIEGTIDLSDNIKTQILSICKNIDNKYDKFIKDKVDAFYGEQKVWIQSGVERAINKFKELPWYKRMFFTEDMIIKK